MTRDPEDKQLVRRVLAAWYRSGCDGEYDPVVLTPPIYGVAARCAARTRYVSQPDRAEPTRSWATARSARRMSACAFPAASPEAGSPIPMTERTHHLSSRYEQLGDRITGEVVDSIAISARSHGRLHLPGEHSDKKRPPVHRVKLTSTDPDNTSVYPEERLVGGPERYLVTYDVWNHRDSPVVAEIVVMNEAAQCSYSGGLTLLGFVRAT